MITEGKESIITAIREAKHIGLFGHKKGDGDSFGSLIALKLAFEKLGKNSKVFSEMGLPADLEFLYGFFNFKFESNFVEGIDLVIVLDCSDAAVSSLPSLITKYQQTGVKIVQIDHHLPSKLYSEADVKWVDSEYCSVAEMVFEILKDMNIEIDRSISTALLTGINTDTSSFQNQNTSEFSLEISSELMRRGARLGLINKKIEAANSINKLKLLGLAFDRLSYSPKYKAAVSYLLYQDYIELGLKPEEVSGIVNTLNQIKGAKMIVFLTETEPGEIHVSLRTRDKDVDVSKIAQFLGGGGHIKAAGFNFPGRLTKEAGKLIIS